MENFYGTIIEESLEDKSILSKVNIISTEVKQATEKYKTPWVKQWTLHSVEIEADYADRIAEEISRALDREHNWYADFKNNTTHFLDFTPNVIK